MSDPLEQLPPALTAVLREISDDPRVQRRLLLAPDPEQAFRSAWDQRALWQGDHPDPRAARWARRLGALAATVGDLRRPYFPAPGTDGALQSPFPGLDPREYWAFVELWDGEAGARRWLESPQAALGGATPVAWLADQRAGLLGSIRRALGGEAPIARLWRLSHEAWLDGAARTYG